MLRAESVAPRRARGKRTIASAMSADPGASVTRELRSRCTAAATERAWRVSPLPAEASDPAGARIAAATVTASAADTASLRIIDTFLPPIRAVKAPRALPGAILRNPRDFFKPLAIDA